MKLCRSLARMVVAASAAFGAIGWAQAQTPPLRVCIAHDNEPLSYVKDGKPKGLDVRIAQAIADELGRPLSIVPFETDYERESTLPREVSALLSSNVCELVSGFPLLREDIGTPPSQSARTPDYPGAKRRRERPFITLQALAASRPYQGMALVVVLRREASRKVERLSDLGGLRIGSVAGTLSSAALTMYRNGALRRDLVSLPQRGVSVFELIQADKLDAGLVAAGLYDAWRIEHPDSTIVLADYRRPLGINLGFVAAPQGATALQAASRVIERALERGDLAKWAAEEGVSWMRPTQPDVSRGPSMVELAQD
ncbi:MAG TPA: transporter substrate-binding domain-containing protein [Burkholderiaceae bacterium]|nr:transporter substrate-binding domain-containing protein [Burkholderiaceae bacterium]